MRRQHWESELLVLLEQAKGSQRSLSRDYMQPFPGLDQQRQNMRVNEAAFRRGIYRTVKNDEVTLIEKTTRLSRATLFEFPDREGKKFLACFYRMAEMQCQWCVRKVSAFAAGIIKGEWSCAGVSHSFLLQSFNLLR